MSAGDGRPVEAFASVARMHIAAGEAQAVARLKHPNIVTIHSVEEIDGVHVLTMEFVEGKTLPGIAAVDV